jgi:voltage-gated potassium channel
VDSRTRWAITLVLAVGVVGTGGYMLIEGWGFLDALYMMVITVGTVGFMEIHPLSDAGRLFTVALIMAGVGTLGFAFGTFIDFIVGGQLRSALEGRRMARSIAELTNHHIVAGVGRVGSVVARQLADEGVPFAVVDESADAVAAAREIGWPAVLGDATEEWVLRHAGVERARGLVAALETDAENLFVTVTARSLNPDLFIVARSTHESSEAKLLKGGADRVITPNVIGGRRMAAMIIHPVVSDYLDLVSHGGEMEFKLQEVELHEDSSMVGLTIGDARVRERTGAYILAIRQPDGTVDSNPQPSSKLEPGQRLVALGTEDQVCSFANVCALPEDS